MATHKSNIDLINECDNFPYPSSPKYRTTLSSFYTFYITPCPHPVGYILPQHALSLEEIIFTSPSFSDKYTFDHTARTLTLELPYPSSDLPPIEAEAVRSDIMAQTARAMQESGKWAVLKGWRDELYPIYGEGNRQGGRTLLCSVERAASAIFGIVTFGCHMTAYTTSKDDGAIKIWVPRRAKTKSTYPGMLDNTVAGGIATGEQPFECVVREAAEEASLPEDLVRKHVKAVGTVTYLHIRDERAGGETGLLQPECQFIYDLDLTEAQDVELKPSDDEVESFELMEVEEIRGAMGRGEFKPNCAVVLLDFFVRHGLLTSETERDYMAICSRLHRDLTLATA